MARGRIVGWGAALLGLAALASLVWLFRPGRGDTDPRPPAPERASSASRAAHATANAPIAAPRDASRGPRAERGGAATARAAATSGGDGQGGRETPEEDGLLVRLDLPCPSLVPFVIDVAPTAPGSSSGVQVETRLDASRIPELSDGSYRVTVSAPGWGGASARVTVGAEDERPAVTLAPSPEVGCDGLVLDGLTGEPLDTFALSQEYWVGPDSYFGGRAEFGGARGAFRVAGVPAGASAFALSVRTPSGAVTSTEPLGTDRWHSGIVLEVLPEAYATALVQGVVVDEGSLTPIAGATARVVAAAAVERHVWLARGEPLVLGAKAGEAGEDEALAPDGARGPSVVARSVADGSFRLRSASFGRRRILVSAPGRRPWLSDSFDLARGRTVDLGSITLGTGAVLEGTLWTSDEVVAHEIVAERADGFRASAVISEGGVFLLSGLPPGTFSVTASIRQGDDVVVASSARVTIEASERVRLDLHHGSGLGGAVVRGGFEGRGGVLQTWYVGVALEEPVRLGTVDADASTFEILDVEPGRYSVFLFGVNDERTRFAASVLSSVEVGEEPVELGQMPPGSTLRIQTDGRFQLRSRSGDVALDALIASDLWGAADGEGLAEVYGLPPGDYVVRSASHDATVTIGRDAEIVEVDLR